MASRAIILHGHLREELGERFEMAVKTAGEAFRALNANFPGKFIALIKEGSYCVIRGDEKTGMSLDEACLNEFNLGDADLHIIPVVEGSAGRSGKGGGGLKVILGVALISVAIFMSAGAAGGLVAGLGTTAFSIAGTGMSVTWGTIALFGLAMAVTGASAMLSPKEKPKSETKREDSYAFSGPINTNAQGNPVPLIYGRVMTGGQPISSGIDIEDISTWSSGSTSSTDSVSSGSGSGSGSTEYTGSWNSVDDSSYGSGVAGSGGVMINGTPTYVYNGNWNSV
jgi:predicted phage tail protein